MFGTWEHHDPKTSSISTEWKENARDQVREVIHEIKNLGLEDVPVDSSPPPTEPRNFLTEPSHGITTTPTTNTATTNDEAKEEPKANGETPILDGAGKHYKPTNTFDMHMQNQSIVLIGAVHELTAQLLVDIGVIALGFDIGPEIANNKWVFDLLAPPPVSDSSEAGKHRLLPQRMWWGEIQRRHYPLVRSRTAIPRQDRTLVMLPSVAIYPDDPERDVGLDPIAWAFLGVDDSVTTLHVQPEYRGRGLAKAVMKRLWDDASKKSGETTSERTERWAHADVLVGNDASNGLCKSLGGKLAYVDYWVRIDTSRI